MKKSLIIALKELETYFKSPGAYIILVITVSIFNFFFFLIIDQNREASLRDVFKLMEFLFVFIVPLLTMRVFAEEKRSGTIEFLMTSPVSNSAIVLGKYLGSLTFLTVIIALTSVYYFIMEYFGSPDKGAMITGYLGIWMEGALFTAIGLMCSSWTRSQIVAALSSYAIIFTLYFSISTVKYLSPNTQEIIRAIGCWSHLENLSSGLIALNDITYYLSGIIFCLIITRVSIENKWWQ